MIPRRLRCILALAATLLVVPASPTSARISVTVRVAVAGGVGALAWGLAVAWSESAGLVTAAPPVTLLAPTEDDDPEPDRGWAVVLPLLVIPLH